MPFLSHPRLRSDLQINQRDGAVHMVTLSGDALVLDEGQWAILQRANGERNLEAIAQDVSSEFDQEVTAEMLEGFFEELRQKGIFTVLSGGLTQSPPSAREGRKLARKLRSLAPVEQDVGAERVFDALARGEANEAVVQASQLLKTGGEEWKPILNQLENELGAPRAKIDVSWGRIIFPIVQPQRHLALIHRLLRPLFSWPGVFLYAVFVGMGVYFATHFSPPSAKEMLDPRAIALTYVVGVVGGVVHEYAHALWCVHFGGYVPSMGIGTLWGLPITYADVTASYVFAERWKRITVMLAGMGGSVGVLAVCGWVAYWSSSPGWLVSGMALSLTVTTVSQIFLNLLPFIKLDGYYILSDLLGIDNLSSKAWTALRALAVGKRTEEPRQGALLTYALGSLLFLLGTTAWLITRGIDWLR